MSQLVLPGEGHVIASQKPSDTYVSVLLLQPVQFPHERLPRYPDGDPIVCNWALATKLADMGVGAILYERERRVLVAVTDRIHG